MPKSDDRANKFCSSLDLTNEASVESFFVLRLLADLGYGDKEIKTKHSIDTLEVAKGRRKEPYTPDFVLYARKRPRWLIDAKSTTENPDDYTHQAAGYCLALNRRFDESPVKFYMLTNGLLTRVYAWDKQEPVLSLRFADFRDGNPKFVALHELLGAPAARTGWAHLEAPKEPGSVLIRPPLDAVKRAFLRCHNIIWKSEKMSPQAAFVEFAKLLFVKLWEDRHLRDDPALLAAVGRGEPIPWRHLRFSTRWVAEQEANTPNPVADILFRQLAESLEKEIAQRKRKRIFEPAERLNLGPGTVRRVVRELERFYLFGIDEDLNGRMFEAFLTATMRGQALGQYFTPRSVVKLMTRLAEPKAASDRVERVLDGCCGTGGFLIEALTEMRGQLYSNTSLTNTERTQLLEEVANQAIFGIDAGTNPPIARVARINMYLHGDGGSRIYMTDGLRRVPESSGADTVEVQQEVQELRGLLVNEDVRFDVVLTNPPFSMDYTATVPEEKEVLDSYLLRTYQGKKRNSLRSAVMFIEQYWHLLKPGGRLLTVIDDSVLSGRNYAFVRDFIRERFVIRGIISLHGDAFQRAGARAKTSILYLTKRTNEAEEQPAAFVYESLYVGRDDVVPRTAPSVAEEARIAAANEIDEIIGAFGAYQRGSQRQWTVAPEALQGRLDAKFLMPWSVKALEPQWKAVGATSVTLGELCDVVLEDVDVRPDTYYEFLRISYEGRAERGEQRLGKEISYPRIGTAHVGDIVLSNINAVHGASCVVPEGMDDLLVSNEYTVLRLKEGVEADPHYLWSVLRSAGVVAEWLSGASGVGRHRVNWGTLKGQSVPLLPLPLQKSIGDRYRDMLIMEAQAQRLQAEAVAMLSGLDLDGASARDRLARAKPPR